MLIDVSHFQGTIDWPVTAGSVQGAYVKITEGSTLVDPNWVGNHAGVTGAGLPVGPYHFGDGGDPVAEADHFADQYLTAAWSLDPVLDAEVAAITAAWVVAFRARFRARTGHQRFRVYASVSFLTGQLAPAGWIDAQTTIWAARYAPTLGFDHPQLVLWQNSSSATVPGISGSVDIDQFQNGWTPAADGGGNVTNPVEQDIAAFIYVGGPSTDAAIPGRMPSGVSDTSLFGRMVESEGMLQNMSDPNNGVLARLTALQQQVTALTATVNMIEQQVAALQPPPPPPAG